MATKVSYLLFLFLITKTAVFSQTTGTKEIKRLSASEAKNDFLSLVSTLKEYHPALYQFTSESEFVNDADNIVNSINDSISELELHVLIRKYLVKIGCGHTVAIPSEESYAHFKKYYAFIPFEIYYINGKLYIKHVYLDDLQHLIGAELISIENKKSDELLRDLKQIQQRDGRHESFIDYNIQDNFRIYYRFLYEQKSAYSIEYKLNGVAQKTIVPAATIPANMDASKKLDTTNLIVKMKSDYVNLYQSGLNQDWNVLKVKSFDTRKYKQSYKEAFKLINGQACKHLIIDLRDNGGGYFPNGNYFLRYLLKDTFSYHFYESEMKDTKAVLAPQNKNSLTKFLFALIPDRQDKEGLKTNSLVYKPIKRNAFKGTVYVLINGGTFSMASSVSSYLKHGTEAQFVGEEAGGGEKGSNGILMSWFVLPQSKIRVMIPFFHVDHSFGKAEDGRGVMPDISINYSIEDLLKGKDKELEYLETLMK